MTEPQDRTTSDHTAEGRRVSLQLIAIGLGLAVVAALIQHSSINAAASGLWSVVQILVMVGGAMLGAGFIGLVLVALGLGRR